VTTVASSFGGRDFAHQRPIRKLTTPSSSKVVILIIMPGHNPPPASALKMPQAAISLCFEEEKIFTIDSGFHVFKIHGQDSFGVILLDP
jgi:hypothetical protein